MKRIILLLLLAVLLLAACSEADAPVPMTQPVTFYYRTAATDFSSEEGVIRGELRDLGAEHYTDRQLFNLYLEGPQSEDLILPFSQDTELSDVRRRGGTLELQLTRNTYSPTEFNHSLAYACLAKTALSLDGIYKVRIEVRTRGGALEDDVLLSENDILLYDNGSDAQNMLDVTLYYADEAGSLLLTEKRSVPMMSQDELPQYVLELLLSPPQSGGMRTTLPAGTAILDDLSVEGGICSVDFNGDFYDNRPESEQAEQLALLSVVNTLCQLDGINQVQFYVQGNRLSSYVYLRLSEPWMMDSAPVGPIREELGEFAETLCLPGQNDKLLHRLTVRARASGSATREEALLRALFARIPQNGLDAPFSGASAPLSVSSSNGICTVVLAKNTLPADTASREMAIRSITASLCSIPEINAVVLREDSDISSVGPLTPESDWFCVNGTSQ